MPEQKGADAAVRIVREYLLALEVRELEKAEQMMAPGATIIFPGGRQYASQGEMVETARRRYQWVRKEIERVDIFEQSAVFLVYVLGHLYGVNSHGVPFSNVRFVDRFEICDGLIQKQEVWNDLAESGVLERRAT